MIKAKKGLIITLFAAMMVFAFGATSAFAAEQTVDWAPDYSKVTVTVDGVATDYPTVRTFITSDNYATYGAYSYDYGKVQAKLDASQVTGAPTVDPVYYFDLGAAVFAHSAGTPVTATYAAPNLWSDVNGLIFSAPDYVANKTETKKEYRPLDNSAYGLNTDKWQGEVKGIPDPDPYTADSTEDMNFTLSLKVTYDNSNTNVRSREFINKVPEKAVTVKGRAGQVSDALFYMDKVTTKAEGSKDVVSAAYDGTQHTVVMNDVKGYTVKYSVYNTETGKWDETNPVTITDAGSLDVRAQLYDAKGEKAGNYFELKATVTGVNAPALGFDQDGNEVFWGDPVYWVLEGSTYDPADFVVVTPAADTKDAVKANEAEWKALFNDFFTVEKETLKAYPGYEFLTIEKKTSKDIDDDAFKALKTKYEVLFANFNIKPTSVDGVTAVLDTNNGKAAVLFKANIGKTDHIYFTEAPNVTYKAKKIKKASKSFTVAAVADSGNAVTFKISSPSKKITINSETGKVTVKKGLKKGSYKVKVYAQTAGGNGYNPAYTYQPAQLTIKIKK